MVLRIVCHDSYSKHIIVYQINTNFPLSMEVHQNYFQNKGELPNVADTVCGMMLDHFIILNLAPVTLSLVVLNNAMAIFGSARHIYYVLLVLQY